MAAAPLAEGREPVERIMLASIVGRPRELAFSHESVNFGQPRIVRVVEITTDEHGETIRALERLLNLDQDAIVPLYAICGEPRTGYDIQVGYWDRRLPVTYPMRDRKEALRFQRFVTGHRTIEHFEGVSCSIFSRGPLGIFWRDRNMQGKGELQFWRPAETDKPPALPPATTEASPGHLSSTAASFSSRTLGRQNSSIVVQSDHAKGREVIISTPNPKPLLVVFLGSDSRYIMMRMDAIDLVCRRRTGETGVDLSQRQSRTFPASSLSVTKDGLSGWDLDAMARGHRHPGLEELQCTNISISFPNATAMDNFEKRLAFLRYQWHKAELARRRLRRGMDIGKLPTTPELRSRASTSSGSSIPVIPGIRLTTDEEWRELEVDLQTRELDGSPLPNIIEMPAGGAGSPLAARARELAGPSLPQGEALRAQFGGREPPPVEWPQPQFTLQTGFTVVERPT
ncbi:hypothetical protein B0T18DRAFT_433549 [Schizothecium vesticola]|uniref:Uncharacterized protein n=1 Tax=Schizothecium vesticola TaxID=314040 RepID=A0AA40BR05_9PEZI|nr:hypothetical protein B0T18DRAFT_433549 [Schizothecium vesticola]